MKLICIKCPRGCELNIDGENITGNACPRGIDYAREELTNPKRIVTYLVKTKDGIVPVKTDIEVPKNMIEDVLKEIASLSIDKTQIGQVVISNILNTGANVIVTGNPYNN